VNTFLPWTVGGAAGKLTLGPITRASSPTSSAASRRWRSTATSPGDVSAASIKSLAVKGEMTSANLILTGGGTALGRATVSGAITSSRIQANAGSIGNVTAGAINGSTIYAGVNTDGGALPVAASDFAAGPPASAPST
jgi:hypothetical protein